MSKLIVPTRRGVLLGAAGLVAAKAADAATLTPRQTAGPFYPEKIPEDSDMDLTAFNGGKAEGEAIEVVGRVLSEKGHALPGTIVEIWQANAHGRYHHSGDSSPEPYDPHFQGFGAVKADKDGAYRFRTIRPGIYPGRTRHIHYRLVKDGKSALVTQMYFPDEKAENERDGLFRWLGSNEAQAAATARTDASGRLEFDIVLG